MAENVKGYCSNVIPENADQIQFAQDIVEYVMLRNCPYYVPEKCSEPFFKHVPIYFDQDMKSVVIHLEKISEKDVDKLLRNIQNSDICSKDYVRLAKDVAADYIPDTKYFNPRYFLSCCVTISKLAAVFYNRGILDSSDLAKTHVLNTLQECGMATSRWDTVRKFTSYKAHMLKLRRLAPDFDSDNSVETDSDIDSAIESEFEAESESDEMEFLSESGEGASNNSLKQEQNGLSKNEDKKL